MTKPQYVTAPMPVQLAIPDGSGETGKTSTLVVEDVAFLKARNEVLTGHRRQWRSVAFRLADALKEIADHRGEDGTFAEDAYRALKAKAAAVIEALDLDGVGR